MRTAIALPCSGYVVSAGTAQQDPPAPTKPPRSSRRSAETEERGSSPPAAADPMKMAAPNPSDPKSPSRPQWMRRLILGPEDQISVFVYQGTEFTNSHMIARMQDYGQSGRGCAGCRAHSGGAGPIHQRARKGILE